MAGPEDQLRGMWRAAIAAAQPAACLPGHWPPPPAGRLAVIACGKAAAAMAAEAVKHYGNRPEGMVILPGDPVAEAPCAAGFRYFHASHPVPDQRSVTAALAALDLAGELGGSDLLLVLLSGGGSALMCLPAAGVTLAEKQALSRQLLACGATIREINCVRKHLSRIKGGRLGLASAAPVITLAISDVPGDDPALIASGPTVADPSTAADAQAVLARYGIRPTAGVSRALRSCSENSQAHGAAVAQNRYDVVASGMTALRAAGNWCRGHGIEPLVLGDELQGEARDLAREHAAMALAQLREDKPVCLLSGGETTVTLGLRPGRGGRNTEYALALALALGGHPRVWALAADTDGIDGEGGHSGAIIDPNSLARAAAEGLDPSDYLRRHDTAALFERIGGLLAEGPTGTNVNDFRAILINR
jgi:hydroxypyruvate reductase